MTSLKLSSVKTMTSFSFPGFPSSPPDWPHPAAPSSVSPPNTLRKGHWFSNRLLWTISRLILVKIPLFVHLSLNRSKESRNGNLKLFPIDSFHVAFTALDLIHRTNESKRIDWGRGWRQWMSGYVLWRDRMDRMLLAGTHGHRHRFWLCSVALMLSHLLRSETSMEMSMPSDNWEWARAGNETEREHQFSRRCICEEREHGFFKRKRWNQIGWCRSVYGESRWNIHSGPWSWNTGCKGASEELTIAKKLHLTDIRVAVRPWQILTTSLYASSLCLGLRHPSSFYLCF